MIKEFFTYIKGHDDRIGATFDARPMIDFALDELHGFTSIVSERLGVVNVGTPAQFAATVRAFSADLRAGHLPFKVPRVTVPAEIAGLVANTIMDALQAATGDPARAQLTASSDPARPRMRSSPSWTSTRHDSSPHRRPGPRRPRRPTWPPSWARSATAWSTGPSRRSTAARRSWCTCPR